MHLEENDLFRNNPSGRLANTPFVDEQKGGAIQSFYGGNPSASRNQGYKDVGGKERFKLIMFFLTLILLLVSLKG